MRGNEFLDKMDLADQKYVHSADAARKNKKNTWIVLRCKRPLQFALLGRLFAIHFFCILGKMYLLKGNKQTKKHF